MTGSCRFAFAEERSNTPIMRRDRARRRRYLLGGGEGALTVTSVLAGANALTINGQITDNGYGVFDDLVEIVFPALGETGVARLKSKLDAALADCPARHDRRADCLRRALQDLASAEGNVDGYIALIPADVRKQPGIAARIGRELLNAGRAAEALVALENGAPKKHGTYLNDDL